MVSGSVIWSPIFKTGLSDVIGSWKIMAISRPRMRRISSSDRCSSSRPSKRTDPCVRAVPGGSSRMTASADTDLPEPNSPTIATISPG